MANLHSILSSPRQTSLIINPSVYIFTINYKDKREMSTSFYANFTFYNLTIVDNRCSTFSDSKRIVNERSQELNIRLKLYFFILSNNQAITRIELYSSKVVEISQQIQRTIDSKNNCIMIVASPERNRVSL